ncbi:MAG TPA: site-specific integrase [Gemmata sp.]
MPRKKKTALPKPRRARGTGALFRDERRKEWVGRIHGREFRDPSQAVVAEWLRTAQPAAPTVTVSEWCDRWLSSLKVKPNTREAYEVRIRARIRPTLGHFQLAKLTAFDIEEAAAKWAGKPSTIRATIRTLTTLLNAARRAKLIIENPASLAAKTEAPEPGFDLFERDELRKVFDTGLSQPEWATFAVLAGTGLRIGEALALRPGDYKAGRLSISRTRTKFGEGTPKSKASRRTIDVPEELHAVLTAGVPNVGYTTALKRWGDLLEAAGLRPRAMHQLRHTFATFALADGYPVADLAAHLGHTVGELLKTYGHHTGADVRPVVRRMLGFLKGA